ncbi:glutathione S-transferase family protein [Erythrobacter sp. HL-111]|uniref:glutathione S-transferase family protein n=1 Tax=Erythrobacter sp. HL-111 TaxID=1798193 RepID=UPI0006DA78FB|nr:glutathione S-transferase family protein [Erythrobacter sp. HL-111]KPP93390.1 MAG: glutathione S-transferase [Erythrobacteraceae bacterium HL-111]SDR70954.1 glutathione S-transferase [Erythrobacter sp. HL-111]
MAEFTFYTVAMSRGQISRWALHEAGADYEHVVFDWDTKPENFRDINPMGKVPALVHHHATSNGGAHDHTVTECAAINHYLAETHPQAGLLPDSHERAAYFRWLFFASGPLEQAIMARMMGWDVPAEREATTGFGSFERTLDALDGWLCAHDFAAGTRFTMADTYVGSQFVWGLRFGTIPERPSFKAYVERVTQRPAYGEANAIDAQLIAGAAG